VLLSREDAGLAASVVRGWVTDLPWFEPGRKPTETVAIRLDGRVYFVSPSSTPTALVNAGATAWREAVADIEPSLVFPLRPGASWARADEDRTDGLYQWNVDRMSRERVPAMGTQETFHLRYQTLPDHQWLAVAPAVGVVAYVYDHHGTTSHVVLRLRAYHPPKRGS
jgi:hypothetical protein